jgi:uncharacterized protein (DUF2336 family)
LDPTSLIEGKDDNERELLAKKVGKQLTVDNLPKADQRAAELVATALADDVIEQVRCALSLAVRQAKYLPRPLALKLAHDVDSVSCPFLEVTDVFSDSDWQQLMLTITPHARASVARRSNLTEAQAIALAELGNSTAAEALVENPAAPMTKPVCHTLMDRFSSQVWILDKLAFRDDLLTEIAIDLTRMVSAALREKLVNTYKLPGYTDQLADVAELGALLQIVSKAPNDDLINVAGKLNNMQKLTPALLLKALEENHSAFVIAAISVLAGQGMELVQRTVFQSKPDELNQLCTEANIPAPLHQIFCDGFTELRRQKGNAA